MKAYQHYLDQRGVDVTNDRLQQIQNALDTYVQANQHYPCPAPINAPPGDPSHGKSKCTAGSGVTEVSGTGDAVQIGGVPLRDLGLSDTYIADGWDHRFTYAVTKKLEQAATFDASQGRDHDRG